MRALAERQNWRRLALLLFSGAVLSLMILIYECYLALQPSPMFVDMLVGNAHIFFSADRSRTILPTECVLVRWNVEGIRAVYLNGNGVVGSGERLWCLTSGSAPTLQIIFADASTRDYALPLNVVLYSPLTWLLIGLASSLGLAAGYLLELRWAIRGVGWLNQVVRKPALRTRLVDSTLLLWMLLAVFAFWLSAGKPGLDWFLALVQAGEKFLQRFFTAPTLFQ